MSRTLLRFSRSASKPNERFRDALWVLESRSKQHLVLFTSMRGADYIDVGPDTREHPQALVSMNSNRHDASSSSLLRPLNLRSVRDRIISYCELYIILIGTHYTYA